jgi:HlyD family secretion protein
MDIQRKASTSPHRFLKYIYLTVIIVVVLLVILSMTRLKPAMPSAERATLLIDTVKRGSMLIQVRGQGALIPEEVRVIAASTEGRVERILVQPGAVVGGDTELIQLSNPELQQGAQDAEYQLRAIEADYTNLRIKLEGERMNQQAGAATVRADYQQAKLQTETDEALAKDGLIPALSLKLSRVKTAELANRYQIEQERLKIDTRSTKAQLIAQEARVSQTRALLELKRSQVQALSVRAGAGGVLQQMQVEVGQQITPGTNLARVAEPSRLKAELKINESQAKDIQVNQKATIDTHNGIISGHVMRIDPSVQQGTVTVDIALDSTLPQGARPDLSVDGTVELDNLTEALYVARPAFGQAQSTVTLFKLVGSGSSAVRTQVKLGRSSVNTVEILEGLREGDQVILSDTSAWDTSEQISLK